MSKCNIAAVKAREGVPCDKWTVEMAAGDRGGRVYCLSKIPECRTQEEADENYPVSNSPLMKQWPDARSKNPKRPLKLATKPRSGVEMMNTRLLLVIAFTFATTNSVLADDVQDVKTAAAFLLSPGSSSINCKKMKRLMQVAEKSDRMARVAVACSDDVKESGSGADAMRLPIGVAISSCAATNWKSEFCQGLKILAGN